MNVRMFGRERGNSEKTATVPRAAALFGRPKTATMIAGSSNNATD